MYRCDEILITSSNSDLMIIYSPEAATRIEVTYKATATGLPHDNAWGNIVVKTLTFFLVVIYFSFALFRLSLYI